MSKISVGLVGASGVGKSSLIFKLINPDYDTLENESQTEVIATYDHRLLVAVDGTDVERIIELHDTVGQERFDSLPSAFYHQKQIILFVYDISDEKSFVKVENYVAAGHDSCDKSTIFALIGNKTDLESSRELSRTNAEAYACDHGLVLYEVSATDHESVYRMFRSIVEKVSPYDSTSAVEVMTVTGNEDDGGDTGEGCC